MCKNLIHLYCLSICFISAIILIVTLGISFNSFSAIIFTEYKLASNISAFSSNDQYIDYKARDNEETRKRLNNLTEEEIRLKRIMEQDYYIQDYKKEAVGTIINCIIWFLIAAVFFITHWRLQKKENQGI